ncbi:hypothetical protein D3C83_182750 [compost metagenome]
MVVVFATQVLQVMGKFMHIHAAGDGIFLILDSLININNTFIVIPAGCPAFFIAKAGVLHEKTVRAIFNYRWCSGMRIL